MDKEYVPYIELWRPESDFRPVLELIESKIGEIECWTGYNTEPKHLSDSDKCLWRVGQDIKEYLGDD